MGNGMKRTEEEEIKKQLNRECKYKIVKISKASGVRQIAIRNLTWEEVNTSISMLYSYHCDYIIEEQ
jgi:hypothetical protein